MVVKDAERVLTTHYSNEIKRIAFHRKIMLQSYKKGSTHANTRKDTLAHR